MRSMPTGGLAAVKMVVEISPKGELELLRSAAGIAAL